MENEIVVPFSNGTEAMNWQEHNCFQCNLYENNSTTESEASCIPAYHIDLGFIEGEIPLVSAGKIGISCRIGRSVVLLNCKMKLEANNEK